ncbi:MAG: hypothetical protein JWO57_4328 [Pseudonocardiales bacterium]|nr:hypothetical protein [Pseudonocardiales bacterium]
MAAQRVTGLTDDQVVQLRNEVTAGRRPRVRVTGAQFPDGTRGTVVRVGDPSADGGEFLTVRVKVGGVSDELGFSPKELSVAGRAGVATAPAVPAARAGTRKRSPQPSRRPEGARATPPATPVSPRATPATPAVRAATPAAKAAGGPQRRAAPGPAVTIAIASAGSSWSVTAHRGARVVVKKAPVTPGVVAAIAALLNESGVEDAVATVNDSALGEAEARADKLRAELAQVEAVLISHRRP